jgi:predicted PurR-regulated permease PerM
VLLGVLGGAAAFGFIGVFLGPVLLAVGYALLMEWAALRTGADIATVDANDEARGE